MPCQLSISGAEFLVMGEVARTRAVRSLVCSYILVDLDRNFLPTSSIAGEVQRLDEAVTPSEFWSLLNH